MTAPLLECKSLAAGYGAMAVVRDLDLHVEPGEVVALVGPNGAGKTTTLLTLAGELPAISGEVSFGGLGMKAPLYRRARRGMRFVTEERSVFMKLTAAENLRVAGVPAADVVEIFPELEPLLGRVAGLLSGGEQQMLTLARAVAAKPALLLVDELSLGLAPRIVRRLLDTVRRVRDGAVDRRAARRTARAPGPRHRGSRLRHAARAHRDGRHRRRDARSHRRGRVDVPAGRQEPEGRRGVVIAAIFFVLGVLSMLSTCLALFTPRRPLIVGWLAWVVGLVPCEVPRAALVMNAVLLGASVVLVPLDAALGIAAIALFAAAMVGDLVLARRSAQPSRRSDERCRPLWVTTSSTKSILISCPSRAARSRSSARASLRSAARRRDVEHVADVPYGDAGERNRLDLYFAGLGRNTARC